MANPMPRDDGQVRIHGDICLCVSGGLDPKVGSEAWLADYIPDTYGG